MSTGSHRNNQTCLPSCCLFMHIIRGNRSVRVLFRGHEDDRAKGDFKMQILSCVGARLFRNLMSAFMNTTYGYTTNNAYQCVSRFIELSSLTLLSVVRKKRFTSLKVSYLYMNAFSINKVFGRLRTSKASLQIPWLSIGSNIG